MRVRATVLTAVDVYSIDMEAPNLTDIKDRINSALLAAIRKHENFIIHTPDKSLVIPADKIDGITITALLEDKVYANRS